MTTILDYLDFIKLKGKPLAEINPGSDELALNFDDAIHAIKLLRNTGQPILGGDILSTESEVLGYAYELWGDEYIYLNWYCEKIENESQSDYVARSHLAAKDSITKAYQISKQIGKEFYAVLVV